MAGVEERPPVPAPPHPRHHRAEPRPRAPRPGRDRREVPLDQGRQRRDPAGADVAVEPRELRRARDPEPPLPEPRGDDLGAVVQKRHARRGGAGGRVLQAHGDRVAFDGIDVEPVAELRGEVARAHACAHHHAVVAHAVHLDPALQRAKPAHLAAHLEGHAARLQPPGQARGEAVDVAGGIRGRPEPARGGRDEPRLPLPHLLGRKLLAHEPTLGIERAHAAGVRHLPGGLVEVQDAAIGAVVIDPRARGHLLQDRARGHGHAHGGERVRMAVAEVAHELRHPGQLVPARRWVDEERRVAPEHPAQALDQRRARRPDLGVRRRELAAVGVARLHRRATMAVDHGHAEVRLVQVVGGDHAGDPGAEHGDSRHGDTPPDLAARSVPPPSKT